MPGGDGMFSFQAVRFLAEKLFPGSDHDLAHRLRDKIVGRDAAINRVVIKIVASELNVITRKQNMGTFMLAGSTGVGKSETVWPRKPGV